jgi:hypothetical protein
MGVWPSETTTQPMAGLQRRVQRVERSILAYWGITVLLGILFLQDWITSWNVGATLARPWLAAYLVITWTISQSVYMVVARHGERPIHWGPTVIFALFNGICETFAFALVYRAGQLLGSTLAGLVFPSIASIAGFGVGILFFIIYGGLIHGLFWIKLLPPHFDESPLSRALRNIRPLIEVLLVSGWSLCFWLTQDIWSVVFFHILVDFILMLRVRPPLFTAQV